MCDSCVSIYQSLKDIERPCRRSGCKGSWIDKRGGQLARAVRGKTGDPYPQYCDNCAKEIVDLEDRQVPCKTDNCTGTWTWTKTAQLAAGVRPELKSDEARVEAGSDAAAPVEAPAGDGAAPADAAASDSAAPERAKPPRAKKKKRRREIRPPERRCQVCSDFLTDRKTTELPCHQCGTPIYWPPESQLQTHLGAWAEPQMCGACKRDATEAARALEREALRHGGAAAQITGAAHDVHVSEAPEAPAAEPSPPPEASDPTAAS
jgi:hypothetical protein